MPHPSLSGQSRAESSLELLRGKPVPEFFPELCRRHPEILELRFATYRRSPGLGKRLRHALRPEHAAIRAAAERCGVDGVGFPEAFLSIAMAEGAIPDDLVDLAVQHNFQLAERNFTLMRDRVIAGEIDSLITALPEGEGLLMRSRVPLADGATGYIPMLDFSCPCLPGNVRAIRRMVRRAGTPEGVLAESGHSYHFYGTELLTHELWLRFMAIALLFAPVTDGRYVAHRLADGECRLKIADSDGHFVPLIQEIFPQ